MKKFLFGVFVWFLVQLVLLSAIGNMNTLKTDSQWSADCHASKAERFIMGAVMPLDELTFVRGDWCWNQN